MDLKTLLDNLHDEVSCSVCMCTYTDPKQLPCLHSFCLRFCLLSSGGKISARLARPRVSHFTVYVLLSVTNLSQTDWVFIHPFRRPSIGSLLNKQQRGDGHENVS